MTFSITATPAQYAGANGESPAHVVVDIPTTEVITKVTRTDSRGVTELFPDAARAIPNNYPGIGGAVVTRKNLVPNPSFEAGVTGWTPTFSGGPITRVTFPNFFGRVGLYEGQTASDGSGAYAGMRSASVAATPGRWVVARAWVANDSAPAGLQVRLKLVFNGSEVSTSWAGAVFNVGKFFTIVAQVPSAATTVFVEPQLFSGNSTRNLDVGTRMFVDQVSIESFHSEASAQDYAARPYIDGDTAPSGNLKYRWTGTADASPSEEYFSGWRVTDDGCPFETVTYTAHVAAGTQSVTVNNDRPEMPVLLTTLTGGAEWVIAEQITEYTANRETGHVHHDVGDAYPLVTYGPRKLRTGTVGIYCSSHAEALKVEAVLTDRIALIRQHVPGLDLTVSVTRATLTPYEGQHVRTRWAVSVEFTEVVYTPVKRII